MIPAEAIDRARSVQLEDELSRRGVRLRGQIERTGPCPVCGGVDRFAVNTKKQVFNCRGCGVGGDIIALIRHLDGVDFAAAVEILAGDRARTQAKPPPQTTRQIEAENYEQQQHQKAGRLWRRRGGSAERYLRDGRGIRCPLPLTIGYLPPANPEHAPALIAAFGIPSEREPGVLRVSDNGVTAVQLTLLSPDGSGKAEIKPNKLTIGSPAGLPIVVAPMNDLLGLAIAEGIENALSIHDSTGLGAWAAGGASNLPKLVGAIESIGPAAAPEAITIYIDPDDAGRRNGHELARGLMVLSQRWGGARGHFDVFLKEELP
jgi:putative DNA primase/helicase